MGTEISAQVLREPKGAFELVDGIVLDDPRPDEALVRFTSTGLCHTDLFARDALQRPGVPSIYGHEGTGVVEAVGSGVTYVSVGDRVAVSFAWCGGCRRCLAGKPYQCAAFNELNMAATRPDGSAKATLDGRTVSAGFFGQSSFATHGLVAERSLVKVPEWVDVGDEHLLGPLGCGVQTGAGAVLNRLRPGPLDSLVVAGAGAVGLSAVMAAAAAGVGTIIAVDLMDSRLELARELGATACVRGDADDQAARIRELTGGGATHAFDTTAAAPVLSMLVEALDWGGRLGIVGLAPGMTLDLLPVMQYSREVIGIIEGDAVPRTFIPQLLELRRQGRFPLEKLVRTYPFADLERAIVDSGSGAAIKAVLVH